MKKALIFIFLGLFLVSMTGFVLAETYEGDGTYSINLSEKDTFIADNGWSLELTNYKEYGPYKYNSGISFKVTSPEGDNYNFDYIIGNNYGATYKIQVNSTVSSSEGVLEVSFYNSNEGGYYENKDITIVSLEEEENESEDDLDLNESEDEDESGNQVITMNAAQIQKIKQIKNRLQIHLNTTECPQNCTCAGSTIKCGLKGDRTMTVVAGNSGNTIIQVKGVNASTNVELYKLEEKLYGTFNGETKRIMTPEQVQEKIRERKQKTWEEHNITLDEEGYYRVQSKKKARLFLLIPVREKVRTQINAETGEIIKIRNPWWGFLANDIKEQPRVGESCGTVSPTARDECCENKGYDVWDSEENECVFSE